MRLTHTCNFHKELDLTKVKPISNIRRNKPTGGIWFSINNSWERWCEDEMPEWLIGTRYVATLKPSARILWVRNERDLATLPDNPDMEEYRKTCIANEKFLDFEALEKKYDAIAVMARSGEGLYYSLYGWDCDSMLVFHPEVIANMRKTTSYKDQSA